ncbi:MAG: ribose-5-phosphate isomerase RpiA [Pseudomonadota bacterium]
MSAKLDAGKKQAATKALDYVERGMTLGIGTGSTARFFIDGLRDKIAAGWSFKGVPTSEETERLAAAAGVDIITPDETTRIDLAIDGADEADPDRNLIKGGGGALLREKIVASAAEKFIVIADKSKRVPALGGFPLPVEIEPFAWALTIKAIRAALDESGYQDPNLQLRTLQGVPFRSDGGNLILDCSLERITAPAALDAKLNAIAGVVETGLFCNMADVVIFGDEEGVSVDS